MNIIQQKSTILLLTLGQVGLSIDQFRHSLAEGLRNDAHVATVGFFDGDHTALEQQVPGLVQRIAPELLISAFPTTWHEKSSAALVASVKRSPWHGSLLTLLPRFSDEATKTLRSAGSDDVLALPLNFALAFPRIVQLIRRRMTPSAKGTTALNMHLGMVGESLSFRAVAEQIPILANSDATVLITGETGTGKGVAARAIHALSPRKNNTFVAVQCGALPERLVENELFGHTSGAYTDAGGVQKGLVEESEGGTLFLDEVDSLPLVTQAKILWLVQDKQYRPLGSGKTRTANIRIIAATNADLYALMQEGKFRSDLFHRLNVLPLHIPLLAERPEDIPILAQYFLTKHTSSASTTPTLSAEAIALLQAQAWTGNVRELENLIERVCVLTRKEEIGAGDLGIGGTPVLTRPKLFAQAKSQAIAEFERRFIEQSLREHHGNISRSAKAVGKDRRVFYRLMQKYGISPQP